MVTDKVLIASDTWYTLENSWRQRYQHCLWIHAVQIPITAHYCRYLCQRKSIKKSINVWIVFQKQKQKKNWDNLLSIRRCGGHRKKPFLYSVEITARDCRAKAQAIKRFISLLLTYSYRFSVQRNNFFFLVLLAEVNSFGLLIFLLQNISLHSQNIKPIPLLYKKESINT